MAFMATVTDEFSFSSLAKPYGKVFLVVRNKGVVDDGHFGFGFTEKTQ